MIEETSAPDKMMERDAPQVEASRAALVTRWLDDVKAARNHWSKDFKRMRRNMKFAGGKQWPNQTEQDDRFMVNLIQRVVKSTVSALYAKNPTVVAKRRKKLDFMLWDGTAEAVLKAQQTIAMAQQQQMAMGATIDAGMAPQPADPGQVAMVQAATELLADVKQGSERRIMLDKIGKTLVACMNYYLDENEPGFKLQMKQMMRRARTTGVGYVKLGFQREMELTESQSRQIADMAARLATIGRLTADLADGVVDPYSAEAEELRLATAALQSEPEKLVREGLTFTFPNSTRIIPSVSTEKLMGWVGSEWVAEEIMLTPDRIKEVYGVDIGTGFTPYRTIASSPGGGETRKASDRQKGGLACVFHIYDKITGMELVVCEGYADFLREPRSPDIFIEQFLPIFPVTFNDVEDEGELFPKSDVEMLMHIQREYNRSKEAMRQHRIANRPLYLSPNGAFDEEEVESLEGYAAHAVIKVNGLEKGRPASDLLAPVQKIGIDPNLYETAGLFDDILRVTGNAEANLGGTGNSSATESNIAEGSRKGSLGLDSDDLDEMLSALFRAGGAVLLTELDKATVQEIAGIGAVWPELSRAEVAKEMWLEVKGGSSGRPNQAQDAANFERLAPTLLQIPGVSPRWLAERAIQLLDDDTDIEDAVIEGLPSIIAQNSATQPSTGDPATDPNGQGGHGNDPQQSKQTGNAIPSGFPANGRNAAG